ncbi:MAG: ECF-type sigma factor [Bryobacteraceae bacterium]
MRQIVSTMPTEVIGKLLSGIANYSQPGYADLVEALARDFQAACPDKKFFPVSWLRESFRQMIRRTPLSAAQRLIANRAAADAILEVMAGSSAPQTSELGKVLRDFVNTIDARDPVKGLVLRLHYILGLGSDAIVELAANGDARELRKTVEELAAELQQTPAVKNVLDSQNLRPKGNVTLLMEQVRDGQRPLADVIADMDVFKNLQRQAAFSIAREGRISLQASDLLSEFVIRLLPQKPEKAPFNHYEFEALSKRIMHNILVDRSRRREPNRGAAQLPETQSDPSEPVVERLTRQEAERIVEEELRRLRQADPETAEMVTAVYSKGVDQAEVARLHAVSVSTVKRRIKDFKDRVRERLGME